MDLHDDNVEEVDEMEAEPDADAEADDLIDEDDIEDDLDEEEEEDADEAMEDADAENEGDAEGDGDGDGEFDENSEQRYPQFATGRALILQRTVRSYSGRARPPSPQSQARSSPGFIIRHCPVRRSSPRHQHQRFLRHSMHEVDIYRRKRWIYSQIRLVQQHQRQSTADSCSKTPLCRQRNEGRYIAVVLGKRGTDW